MPITLGKKSLERLDGVDPRLVRVVKRAALMANSDEDFTVLEGVRTKETMWSHWGKGRTVAQCRAAGVPDKYANPKVAKVTWLKNPLMSQHRRREDGFGKAVDIAPWPIDWNNLARFDKMANLMFRAASLEGVAIRWGADWDRDGKPRERGESDSPHFELV